MCNDLNKELENVESQLGLPLPTNYRRFLLTKYIPNNMLMFLRDPRVTEVPIFLQVEFYTLVAIEHHYQNKRVYTPTVEFMMRIFKEREKGDGLAPEDAIPIAYTTTYEKIFIYYQGGRCGEVWLKDWTVLERDGVDVPSDGLYYISSSFDLFVQLLELRCP